MSASSDPDGGYGVTPQLSAEIAKRLFDQSPLRQICRLVNIGSFDSYQEPMQIGDAGATWTAENSSRPATTTPTLGLLDVPVNELYATQPVTQRLLDDGRFEIAGFIVERASDRFARTEGTAFVRGTGVGQPQGFMTVATDPAADFTRDHKKLQYVVSGAAGSVTFDGLKNLYWTMRAPHRANASWLMSSATASQLDTLKDANGHYIWRDSVAADVPPTLLGKNVFFSEDMDSVSAGTFPVAFGNWTAGYVIADKPGVRWLRDPYSSKPNVIFYGYKRVGGGVADTDAIKLLKISA
jgi:HK97 family phage major capsid protein